MSELESLAAGILCVGFDGKTSSEAPLAELAELNPGGIILFARNVSDPAGTRALIESVTEVVGGALPPFVAIDQEGGRVARLRVEATPAPAMMAVAAAGDLEDAEHLGRAIARDLRRVGCTVNLAPVLDLASEPHGTVIGARSFGDDPQRVGAFGAALMRGMQREGVAAVLKHFPGHGATVEDSHLALPVSDVPAQVLRSRELAPFVAGIAAGAQGVMTAHVVVRALDPELPATFSRAALTRLLRGELGFTGVCFTDCLEMDAVSKGVGTPRGAVLALAAGADCVLVSHHLEIARAARDAIVEAVRTGELPRTRLEEASRRVAALRVVRPALDLDASEIAENAALAARIARRAVTRVRGELRLNPRVPVTIVSFEGATDEGAQGKHVDHASLNLALRTRRFRSELFRAPLDPGDEMIEQMLDVLRMQEARSLIVLSRRAHLHPAQRRAIETLLAFAPETLLASVREPFDLALFPQARHVACTYGDEEVSIEGLADVIAGRDDAVGTLPVHLSA